MVWCIPTANNALLAMSNSRGALCCLLCRRRILCVRLPTTTLTSTSRSCVYVCEGHKEPCAEAKKDTARLLLGLFCEHRAKHLSLPGIRNARATAAGLSKANFLAYKIKVPLSDCRLIIKIVCCFYLCRFYPQSSLERLQVLCLRNGPRVAQ